MGAPAARAGPGRAYVTNFRSGTVSVIDTGTNTRVSEVVVGSGPEGVAVTLDGTRVYVANFNSNTVSVIDTATTTVVATVAVGVRPTGVAVSPDGSRVYVTNSDDDTVSVISTAGNAVLATFRVGIWPVAVAFSPDGARAYVANAHSDDVSVVDTATNTVVATVPVGHGPAGPGRHPRRPPGLRLQPEHEDRVGHQHGHHFGGGQRPHGRRHLGPDHLPGRLAGVRGRRGVGHLRRRHRPATNTVIGTLPINHRLVGLAVHPSGDRVLAVGGTGHDFPASLSAFDPATGTRVACVPVGPDSRAVAVAGPATLSPSPVVEGATSYTEAPAPVPPRPEPGSRRSPPPPSPDGGTSWCSRATAAAASPSCSTPP